MPFSTYLAADRARALAAASELPELSEGTALFADISGFTPLTDTLARELGQRYGAEELTRYLNTVYDALITVINLYGGSVVGFSGDAVTCWFEQAQHAEVAQAELEHAAALRAVACGLALQQAMHQVAEIRTPGGQTITLALKVAIASGSVRRLLVGSPAHQRLDVLAGELMLRLASVEHQASAGEIVADEQTVERLGTVVRVKAWVQDEQRRKIAVLADLHKRVLSAAERAKPAAGPPTLSFEQARPLLLPAVAERLQRSDSNMPTELRPVVALFVRFATLDYDTDPAAASHLDAYICWTQDVVARYGGVLLQVTIGDKGSYVYVAFGAPIAHEADSERALRAALELTTPPRALDWAGKPQIGVSRGTMRTGAYGGGGRFTYGALGDAVNVAARLMQAAAPGEILVRDAPELAGADLFLWQPLPPLRVKGKPQPLAVFRLLSFHEHRLPTFFQGALIGREAELQLLLETVQPIFAGQFAGVCIVDGEAGVGKSRLVFELRQRLNEHSPLNWAYCPSDEILHGSLRPFATWLREYFSQSAEQSNEERQAQFDAKLDRLLAELRDQPPATNSGQSAPATDLIARELDRTRSFLGALLGLQTAGTLYEQLEPKLRFENILLAITSLIRAESLRQPLLLELEDAHRLDEDSQTLLAALTRALRGYPVAILCAARPNDHGHPFTPAIAEGTPLCVVRLDSLTSEGTHILAAQILSEAVDDTLAQFVFDRTNGNPFYAEQLLLDLRERGLIERRAAGNGQAIATLRSAVADRRSSLAEVPDTLSSLLVARLDRLDEPVREVVQMAAVLGREWAMPVLATMRSHDDDLPPKVHAAEQGQVWSPLTERDYLFRHVLLRDAAYGMQLHQQRRDLHQQALHAIEMEYAESLAPHYATLAYHARAAENHECERRYTRLAGEVAAARYANAEAISYFSRALELIRDEDLEQQCEVLLARGAVLELMGLWGEAETCYQDALVKAAPPTKGRIFLALGKLCRLKGDYSAAMQSLSQAREVLEILGDQRGMGEASVAMGQVCWQQGEYAAAKQQLEAGLVLARASHDAANVSLAFMNLGVVAKRQGNYAEARALTAESLSILRQIGDRRGVAVLLNNQGLIASQQGDLAAARALHEESLQEMRAMGDRRGVAAAVNNLGNVAFEQEDYVAAAALYTETLELRRTIGDRWGIATSLNNLGVVALVRGEYAAAQELLAESLIHRREMGDKQGVALVQCNFGHAALLQGDHRAARTLLAESFALRREMGDQAGMVINLFGLGGVAVSCGAVVRGTRVIAAADTLREALGFTLDPSELLVFDHAVFHAKMNLDAPTFEAAWAEGQRLTLAEAAELALAEQAVQPI
jgi:class 3 adenylate cyclase/tetratricopeptide (TPR) repeat protein